jgi:hypothetical protein
MVSRGVISEYEMPYCPVDGYCLKVRSGFLGLIFLPVFASIPQ